MSEAPRRWPWRRRAALAAGIVVVLSGVAFLVVLGMELHWNWRRLLHGEGKLFTSEIPLPFWHIAALLLGWTIVGAWLIARAARRPRPEGA